ncbi:MAG: hypothetical protein U5R14_02870 [Gemmatimonadota bacterium]|nr:hypothetical protein [Gemmatimonadota bacterium]
MVPAGAFFVVAFFAVVFLVVFLVVAFFVVADAPFRLEADFFSADALLSGSVDSVVFFEGVCRGMGYILLLAIGGSRLSVE